MGSGIRIPVMDMEELGEAPWKLIEACEEWGCFRVKNHGIPEKLMWEMKGVVRSLFDLPLEIKKRNTDAIVGSGYMAPSLVNPLYEAFGLYDVASSQAIRSFCNSLEASPQQTAIIQSYSGALLDLAMNIGSKIAESVGLRRDFVKHWPCQFRINKYNFTQQTVGSPGVQMHTDSGFLTILQDDDSVGGLEVMDKSGAFVAVDPMPGTLLVNLGDIATAWSNGRFCNVKHRVWCKEAAIRVSIALFVLGPKEEVEAPAVFVDAEHPRLYSPFTYEDYRKLRFDKRMQAGEALHLVRLSTTPTP